MELFLFVLAVGGPLTVLVWATLRLHAVEQSLDRRTRMLANEISRHRQAIYELQQAKLNNRRLAPGLKPVTLVPPVDGGTDR